jgi:hypothetical protein
MITVLAVTAGLLTFGFDPGAHAQTLQQDMQKGLAAIKQSLASNQAALKPYTWTSETQILYKGEVKKTKVFTCSYGPDGKLQKTPVGTPAPEKKKRGLRGEIADKKVGDMEEYMDRAEALIHNYVPPSPEKMQAAFEAGNASLSLGETGRIQMLLKGYLKPGDTMTFGFDDLAQMPRTINVTSYLDNPDDAVTLAVFLSFLPDGTNYVSSTNLSAPTKKVVVRVTNKNYQKAAR